MKNHIVQDSRPVTLVGGGEATKKDLNEALALAPTCVAADSGAALALAAGQIPKAVIGDFDSISDTTLAALPPECMHRISEQTSTDFEKALTRISAPVVVGVGFLGARIDHQLAAFHTLLAHPDRPCLLIGQTEVVCLAPPQIDVPTREGEVVSLFPMGEVTGRSQGLNWPIDGLDFAPECRIGTSNFALGPFALELDQPGMLLILPRRLMPELVALIGAPDAARWTARAE